MSKRRGGQPGNVNAVKHGFYSRRFRELEAEDLEAALRDGLGDEIDMMRVVIRRVFDYASEEAGCPGSSEKSPSECLASWSGALSALGAASTRLAGLLRTQKLLGGNEGEAVSALSQALSEVTRDFGCR